MPNELRDEIGAALRELSDGEGATIKAVRAQRALVTLECAIGEATGGGRTPARLDEIAATVVRFLEAAADSLEPDKKPSAAVPNAAMAARAALGLKPELSGKPWRATRNRPGRQAVTVEWLDTDKEGLESQFADGTTARSHLLERMAEHLSLRDSEFVAETRRLAQRERRPPLESAMGLEWITRFERYAKISASVSGLRFDVELALDKRRQGREESAGLYARKALYYFAAFLTDMQHFYAEHGLLWIVPDAKAEDDIANAGWFIRKHTKLGDINESILRIAFGKHRELAPFMHATYAEGYLQPILARWQMWLATCQCADAEHPERACLVHAMLRWATLYMDTIEEQWNLLSDWYDRPHGGSLVDPVRQAQPGLPTLPSGTDIE